MKKTSSTIVTAIDGHQLRTGDSVMITRDQKNQRWIVTKVENNIIHIALPWWRRWLWAISTTLTRWASQVREHFRKYHK